MTRMSGADCLLRGRMYYNRDLSGLGTWRVGGLGERFLCPSDVEDLSCFLRHCQPDIPVFFLGRGSNVLISDAGISGCVVGLTGALEEVPQALYGVLQNGDIVLTMGAGTVAQLPRRIVAGDGAEV